MEGSMPRRQIGQMSWLDGALEGRRSRQGDCLAEVHGLVDWAPLERLLNGVHRSAKGEAAYPPLMMFKVLLLQRWYGLSDPAMEAALFDRISFLRFAGLSMDDETPDHATIWRFREKLGKAGLMEPLFTELQRQLGARGLMVKEGTLIDASLVSSAARRPRMNEAQTSPVDPDARFGTSNERGRYSFGYKLHVAVDRGSALVRAFRLTPANIQEVMVGPDLVQGDEAVVYADRGYDAARMRDHLQAHGIACGIMRRARRNQPLRPEEVEHNHALSLKRRPVEAFFGTLKRSYGFHRMRYFSALRNATATALACFAFNLRRWRSCTAG
ncbi:MAG: IS5 family transposase [Burkholderiales bacterium]|jgi:IS5 family transposase